MGSYYYLMSQLPTLIYDQKPPMSSQDFTALAVSLLEKEDSALLPYVSLDPEINIDNEKALPQNCAFIDSWREWERALRLNLAKNRALKIKRDSLQSSDEPPSYPADAAAAAAKTVNELFASGINPLDAEIALDTGRWNAVDLFLGACDYFSRESVYAYLLKLMLMERRQLFNAEKGFAEYKSQYNEIINNKYTNE